MNGEILKRGRDKRQQAGGVDADEILPEYDFTQARPNKYASRYAEGSVVVVLDPDVAATFPNSAQVNEALRAIAGIIQKHQPHKPESRGSSR